jgi:hypothetical protein
MHGEGMHDMGERSVDMYKLIVHCKNIQGVDVPVVGVLKA